MSSNNTFSSMKPNFKESYSKGKFKKLKSVMGVSDVKAHSEEEASKNPKKFMKKVSNMRFKNLKGVAF